MPVQSPDIAITPYTSTVPLVQIPPSQIDAETRPAGPLPGQFGKKGTGALAIGDAIVKGILAGHEEKEKRKAAQATATIAAADAATQSAYQKYQDALASSGGDQNNPNAKAAYDAYLGVFNQSKAAKAQFVLPEDDKKGQKGEKSKDKKPFGFGGIKEFFAANPKLVPQIALTAMQPQGPGMSTETQQTVEATKKAKSQEDLAQQNLEQAERYNAAEKVVSEFGGLSQEELAALPPEQQRQISGAKALLYGARASQTTREYASPDGTQRNWFRPGEEPQGWQATGGVKAPAPGTLGAYVDAYARDNGITPEQLTQADYDYLFAKKAYDARNGGSTTVNRSTVDVSGNRTSVTTKGGGAAPQPPSGRVAYGAAPQPGGLTPPPQPRAASSQGMAPPPRTTPRQAGTGVQPPPNRITLTDANRTQKVETQKSDRYTKAQSTFDKAMSDNRKALDAGKIDQKEFEKRNNQALSELNVAHRGIEDWYNKQVHAIGGTTGADVRVSVKGPDGKPMTILFKTKKDADAFKREAGIQ